MSNQDDISVKWWDSPLVIGATIIGVNAQAGEVELVTPQGKVLAVDLWSDDVKVVDHRYTYILTVDVDDDPVTFTTDYFPNMNLLPAVSEALSKGEYTIEAEQLD